MIKYKDKLLLKLVTISESKEGVYRIWIESSVAIRKWLPLSLAGAAISLITAFVFHVPIGRAVVAIALVVVLIFSGFLFESLGRGEQGEADWK